jgi:sirohydrochlorin cobaltochelatase
VVARQTSVVGLHPRVADLVRQRYVDLVSRFGLDEADTTAVLVGHGTPKHLESRTSTLACAEALKAERTTSRVRHAFLDDEPSIEEVARSLEDGDAVLIPFLIGSGIHASVDVARRFGLSPLSDDAPPLVQVVGGRRIVLDVPIGCHPAIVDIVVDLASGALGHLRDAQA